MKFHSLVCRDTIWHSEGKERLAKSVYCVTECSLFCQAGMTSCHWMLKIYASCLLLIPVSTKWRSMSPEPVCHVNLNTGHLVSCYVIQINKLLIDLILPAGHWRPIQTRARDCTVSLLCRALSLTWESACWPGKLETLRTTRNEFSRFRVQLVNQSNSINPFVDSTPILSPPRRASGSPQDPP